MKNLNQVLDTLKLNTDTRDLVLVALKASKEFYDLYCTSHTVSDSTNFHGESQKKLDLLADDIFTDAFVSSGLCSLICSEEKDSAIQSSGELAVCFDPLDGSSVIEANFATGSVFGVYRSDSVISQKARDMEVAFYCVYGPNLVFTIATSNQVFMGKLTQSGWEFEQLVSLDKSSILALGNFNLMIEDEFRRKVSAILPHKMSLRYSGALVSDVHMLIVKGGGLFVRPSSESKAPKLRLLYECGPLAFIVEALHGDSYADGGSILDVEVASLHQTVDFHVGTAYLLQEWLEA